jgi:tetratricopeptide (TPR) repeat protein
MQEKTPLQTRKELGLAHLNADRIEEGLKVYAMILRDYPEDVESYVVIGDCYLAQGETETAAQLYAYALELSPDNSEIMRRLRLARLETNSGAKKEQAAPELRAIGRLLQRIMGQTTPVTEQDLEKAAHLLEEIKQSPRPALAVAERLSDIETLIPAMLELNIRQARAEGRPDLAQALDGLLGSVKEQLGSSAMTGKPSAIPSQAPGRQKVSVARILFLIPSAYQISSRAILAVKALTGRGHSAVIATEQTEIQEKFDVAIAFNPHGDAKIMEFMAACAGAKIPVIVDIDRDYEELPASHPAYRDFNVATTERMKTFTAALYLADHITTSGTVLAEKFTARGRSVSVIPHGWMERNGLWLKPSARRRSRRRGDDTSHGFAYLT